MELNTRTLSDSELERLYYQAGLTQIAEMYARAADVQAENTELQGEVEKMYTTLDYDKLERLTAHLQEMLSVADAAVSELYQSIDASKRVNKTAVLKALAALNLDSTSEPE